MSFLPGFLQSSYRQYKEDTSTLTSWLAFTSINAGFVVAEGKESLSKKKNTKSNANRNTTRTFTVGQLLEQARYLVSRDTSILVVPEEIATATSRAINARAKCVDWFQRKFPGTKSASLERDNLQHKYFLDVMRMIRTTLQPFIETSDVKRASEKWRSANRFELLEVEDLEDNPAGESGIEGAIDALSLRPTAPKGKSPAVDNRSTDPSWMFMAFCTFQDFNAIREYLANLWADHKVGKVDLVIASVVTELAYYMMEKMERETLFPTVNGEKWNPNQVAWHFFIHCCRLRGFDCNEQNPNSPREDWKLRAAGSSTMLDIAEWLCLDIQYPVNFWMKPTSPLKAIADNIGQYNPKVDRNKLDIEAKSREDHIILARVIPDMIIISNLTRRGIYLLIIQDALTKHFDAMNLKEIRPNNSISLLFGLRALLDIHAELRTSIDHARGRMIVISKLASQSERSYQSFVRKPFIQILGRESTHEEDAEDLRGLQFLLTNPDLEKDELMDLKNLVYESRGLDPSKYLSMPNSPFSQNPILCGLYALRIQLESEETGMLGADYWWAIMPMAHLYNALKQVCTNPPPWPAMDRLIEAHTPEFLFLGGAPTDLEKCWRKARLAKGLSANMSLSPKAARERGVRKVRDFRKFQKNAPQLFRLIGKHMLPISKETLDHPKFGEMLLEPVQRFFAAKVKSRRERNEAIEPLDLLERVKAELQAELGRLRIDYLTLNRTSISIVQELRAEFISQWREVGFQGYDGGKDDVSSFPHCAEDTMLLAFLSEPFASGDHRVLKRAGEIIKMVLKRRD